MSVLLCAPAQADPLGLRLGSPLLPNPGAISSLEEAEGAARTLDYLDDRDPARASLRKEILRHLTERASSYLDRGYLDDAYEHFATALGLFEGRELATLSEPGLLTLAQRIDGALRRRGAHGEVLTSLAVQLTLAPRDRDTRQRFSHLAYWLSGEAPPEVAPQTGLLLSGIKAPSPTLLRDLEAAFRVWPAVALAEELAALYQRRAAAGPEGNIDLSQLRGARDLVNFSLQQRSPLNAPAFKLARVYLRVSRPQDALQSIGRLPKLSPQEKVLQSLLSAAFRPGAPPGDIVRFASTVAQNPDDQAGALVTCQDLVARNPTLLPALQCTAQLALVVGRRGLALRATDQARALSASDASLWERLLRLYLDRLTDLANDENPRDLGAALTYIESYLNRIGQAFPAEQQSVRFALAISLAEVGRGYYNHGRIDESLKALARATEVQPNAAAVELLGQIQLKRGQAELALRSLEQARALHQADKRGEPMVKLFFRARLGRNLADALERRGQNVEAQDLRQRSVKEWEQLLSVEQLLPERRAEAELERGKLLYILGRRHESLRAFHRALDPAPALPQMNAGAEDDKDRDGGQVYADAIAFLVQQGELEEAKSAYRQALGKSRLVENLKVYCSLWINDLALRSGQPEDPMATAFLRSVQGGKWYAELARWATGQQSAEALLKRADTAGKRAEASFYLGLQQLREGKRPQAEGYFRKVLESDMMAFFEYDMAATYLTRGAPQGPRLKTTSDEVRERPAGSI